MSDRSNALFCLLMTLSLASEGCDRGPSESVLHCRAEVKQHAAKPPPDITTVHLYWDVSGSMQRYVGGSPTGFAALWNNLDARWSRQGSGLMVSTVDDFAVGASVRRI